QLFAAKTTCHGAHSSDSQMSRFLIVQLRFSDSITQAFSRLLLYLPNGLRYLRVGGRGLCLGAGQTRSQKNA
ncbi:MAG: hypothetical protein ABH810_03455, partial [bacterium]